jgi:hypothetical protein
MCLSYSPETWEAKFPNNCSFGNPNKADPLTIAVRSWIYTWMNGSSCGSVDQYDFSKELVLTVLERNAEFHSILGIVGCQKIHHWLNMKVIPLEDYTSFHHKK